MDVCIQKSIVVTSALDKVVRVWNYLKKQLEVVKAFEEEALSMSCHPTGVCPRPRHSGCVCFRRRFAGGVGGVI